MSRSTVLAATAAGSRSSWGEPYREILTSRDLLWELAARDLRIRYKQTILGAAWALFTPLVMMIIFTQIFARVARIDTGSIPYPVFVYCGLLPWQFFASALKGSVESLTRNSRLVTKIYMPREVFPVSQVISSFVDFLVASVVLCGLLAWYRVPIHTTVLLVPFIVLVQLALTTGLSLLLGMSNLFYRDVKYVFEVVILMWMFATSVVYPIHLDGPWAWVVALNPMTPIIDSYRRVILEGLWPDPLSFTYACLIALAVMVGAFRWFHESEHLFAENI